MLAGKESAQFDEDELLEELEALKEPKEREIVGAEEFNNIAEPKEEPEFEEKAIEKASKKSVRVAIAE